MMDIIVYPRSENVELKAQLLLPEDRATLFRMDDERRAAMARLWAAECEFYFSKTGKHLPANPVGRPRRDALSIAQKRAQKREDRKIRKSEAYLELMLDRFAENKASVMLGDKFSPARYESMMEFRRAVFAPLIISRDLSRLFSSWAKKNEYFVPVHEGAEVVTRNHHPLYSFNPPT